MSLKELKILDQSGVAAREREKEDEFNLVQRAGLVLSGPTGLKLTQVKSMANDKLSHFHVVLSSDQETSTYQRWGIPPGHSPQSSSTLAEPR